MGEKLLNISNLTVGFGENAKKNAAVKNVSLELNRGETLGIVGESGSGKSLTCLSMIGLLPRSAKLLSGEISYYGENGEVSLNRLNEKYWRKYRGNSIAMIFQEPMSSLNPVYRCGRQIIEMLKTHRSMSLRDAKNRALKLLEEVKIKSPERIYKSYPHEISGGQKQRVMIALAMACDPDLLIADEPTTALDVTVQKSILELMKSIQKKHGNGIVFVSHDLSVVAEIADKVAVMYKGEVVEYGARDKIFNEPEHPYTKGLLACRPPLTRRVHQLLTIEDYMAAHNQNQMPQQYFLSEEERNRNLRQIFLTNEKPYFKINNLVTTFTSKKGWFSKEQIITYAVNGVSFEVYKGETLGLVGESGCGKSTLGKTLLGLIQPKSGEIYFKGKRIEKLKGKEVKDFKKNVQIIFQDPFSSLNPKISVGDAIMEPMKVHGFGKSAKDRNYKAKIFLEKVGMDPDHFYRYPHEFSGGQRQRISIARTLAVNPEFIICDEAVSALDVSVQAQVLNLLNELKEEYKFTYIFISHDLSVVKFMSDRMIVMNEGKIEEMGEADELYNGPITAYTQKLIQSIPGGAHESA